MTSTAPSRRPSLGHIVLVASLFLGVVLPGCGGVEGAFRDLTRTLPVAMDRLDPLALKEMFRRVQSLEALNRELTTALENQTGPNPQHTGDVIGVNATCSAHESGAVGIVAERFLACEHDRLPQQFREMCRARQGTVDYEGELHVRVSRRNILRRNCDRAGGTGSPQFLMIGEIGVGLYRVTWSQLLRPSEGGWTVVFTATYGPQEDSPETTPPPIMRHESHSVQNPNGAADQTLWIRLQQSGSRQ